MIQHQDIAILVFGFTRAQNLRRMLRSLQLQSALDITHVWIDGDQGSPSKRAALRSTHEVVTSFNVAETQMHRGNLGFRKALLTALRLYSERYKYLIVLEDDCFPTRTFMSDFKFHLAELERDPTIFSCYGSHFGIGENGGFCTRFQGWGWGTSSERLKPVLEDLIRLYSMPEFQYLDTVREALTDQALVNRLEVTPGRNPIDTLTQFFAWDETLALLTAQRLMRHRRTRTHCIRNTGMGEDSTHFSSSQIYRESPFNMITPQEAWDYF